MNKPNPFKVSPYLQVSSSMLSFCALTFVTAGTAHASENIRTDARSADGAPPEAGLSKPSESKSLVTNTGGKKRRTEVLIETDPVTFAFMGYSAHVRIAPAKMPGWTFGLGTYGMRMPKLIAEMHSDNKNKGFELEIRNAYSLFVDYHFKRETKGLFVGVQSGLQRYRLTNAASLQDSEYGTLVGMARVGYLWKPTKTGFYVLPWLGGGAMTRVYGQAQIEGQAYHVAAPVGFATLHVGWQL